MRTSEQQPWSVEESVCHSGRWQVVSVEGQVWFIVVNAHLLRVLLVFLVPQTHAPFPWVPQNRAALSRRFHVELQSCT